MPAQRPDSPAFILSYRGAACRAAAAGSRLVVALRAQVRRVHFQRAILLPACPTDLNP